MKLDRNFYDRDTLTVAKALLGKVLVHEENGFKAMGKIVEVEAYKGLTDKAAHSYHGKITNRVKVMYGEPGHAYVYLIYGMYYCMNVVTQEKGTPEAVLIRAIEPLGNLDPICERRYNLDCSHLSKKQRLNLTNGPGKLCMALSINKAHNGMDLCGNTLYIEESTHRDFTIATSPRIGIDYAEEAKDFPWRYYIEGNPYLSR